jgi:TatD DNase family protein
VVCSNKKHKTLNMILIDTHAHIYDQAYATELPLILERAKAAGMTQIWMPNCDSETLPAMLQIASDEPDFCLPMIGLHPCYVKDNYEEELAKIEAALVNNKAIAVGEIGIDLYWDKSFFAQQQEAFLRQCELALKHNLWIDIHCREAFWETAELIKQIDNERLSGIFHCFSGGLPEAKAAIEMGFLLGIGGVATFKNGGLDKVLPHIPLSKIVLETDAPYLAPVPYRGKRNEPAYLAQIAQKVADIYGISAEQVAQQTSQNAVALLEKYS